MHTGHYEVPSLTADNVRRTYAEVYAEPRQLRFKAGLVASLLKVVLYLLLKEGVILGMKKTDEWKKQQQHQNPLRTPTYYIYNPHSLDAIHPDNQHTHSGRTNMSKHLVFDFVSGATAEFLMLPLSIVIRRLHTRHSSDQKLFGFLECVEEIWRESGVRGFFSGLKFQVIITLLVWFGTMFFFNVFRSMIATAKQRLDEYSKVSSLEIMREIETEQVAKKMMGMHVPDTLPVSNVAE